jgi:hypothetical protein
MSLMLRTLLALVILPAVAAAQSAPTREPDPLPIEIRRGDVPPEAKLGRTPVAPAGQGGAALSEAERAVVEFEQAQRARRFIRGETLQPLRRPDLGYDVSSGIQQKNLQRAPRP